MTLCGEKRGIRVREEGAAAWGAPCAGFDYRQWEKTAAEQAELLRRRLADLKKRVPGSMDEALLLRREIRILTDLYYEQRANTRFFAARAVHRAAREQQEKAPSVPLPRAG